VKWVRLALLTVRLCMIRLSEALVDESEIEELKKVFLKPQTLGSVCMRISLKKNFKAL
jgi:hypothetical protein